MATKSCWRNIGFDLNLFCFSGYLNNQITNKLNEVDEVYTDTLNNIGLIEKDNSSVKQKQINI